MAGKKGKGKKKPGGKVSSRSPPASDGRGDISLATGAGEPIDGKSGIAWGDTRSPAGAILDVYSQQWPAVSGASRRAAAGVDGGTRDAAASSGGSGSDVRGSNGPGGYSRDPDWPRRISALERERERDAGDRDKEKEKGSGPGDECHNGEGLGRSPLVKLSAEKDWSWLSYSTKQFRSFAQEFPPTLDIGMDEVGFCACCGVFHVAVQSVSIGLQIEPCVDSWVSCTNNHCDFTYCLYACL